jgi:hypothetical protein
MVLNSVNARLGSSVEQTLKMKRAIFLLILAGVFLPLTGFCVGVEQYQGIQPVYPMPPSHLSSTMDALGRPTTPKGMPVVDSLQPTFAWQPTNSSAAAYDLEICLGIPKKARSLPGGLRTEVAFAPGKQVYYREGIEGTNHRVEQALSAGTIYVWSIRTRNGTNVSPWSTYSFQHFGLREEWAHNLRWPFSTPGPASADVSAQPRPDSGQGRIYFYREKHFAGSGMETHILLNAEIVGNSMNGGYFYLDRPPGNYVVRCPKGPKDRDAREISLTLGAGETKYVRTRFEGFRIIPTLEEEGAAAKAISKCALMPNILP